MVNEIYNYLFTKCVSVNDYILGKEKNNNLDYIDHFAFQLTSYVIIIHNGVLDKECSVSLLFIYRSIIEIISILEMHKVKGIILLNH